MATATDFPTLLATLTDSLKSAQALLADSVSIHPPKDGISLLDTKNELLLSYLHHLAFLILLRIRSQSHTQKSQEQSTPNETSEEILRDDTVKKLVELRVYLEKGVRPLENRLKYQIDKVVRAADNASKPPQKLNGESKHVRASNGTTAKDDSSSQAGSVSEDSHNSGDKTAPAIDDLAYRPNPTALLRPSQSSSTTLANNNIYRPPRITPTALPTTAQSTNNSRTRNKPAKSATLDEFISTELSSLPQAEPSIGSTIISGGRRSKSQKERHADAERRTYEETNFVRLPKESKKERRRLEGGAGGSRRSAYGGEEFRDLGAGAERIVGLTKRKGSGGALERSRKRDRVERAGAGEGVATAMGERFEKRRKLAERKRSRR
ncbi:hypothetical protein MMC20_003053 [Loxospora ochrophaea]|nr:hypothetical protein [Loxospora ochrophaea]